MAGLPQTQEESLLLKQALSVLQAGEQPAEPWAPLSVALIRGCEILFLAKAVLLLQPRDQLQLCWYRGALCCSESSPALGGGGDAAASTFILQSQPVCGECCPAPQAQLYFADKHPLVTLSQRPKENILLPLAVGKQVLHGSSPFTKGRVLSRKL